MEQAVADLRAEIEEVFAAVSAESVHRMHDKGFTIKEISQYMSRPVSYVKKVLAH